jgi:hypothetical protein
MPSSRNVPRNDITRKTMPFVNSSMRITGGMNEKPPKKDGRE